MVEFWPATHGGKLAVWLFAFSTAMRRHPAFILAGLARRRRRAAASARGSLSGAAVGGALFGMGMILARGCSPAAGAGGQGNLRALLSGLVFAVTAQAALNGVLSPVRLAVPGGGRSKAAAPATCSR